MSPVQPRKTSRPSSGASSKINPDPKSSTPGHEQSEILQTQSFTESIIRDSYAECVGGYLIHGDEHMQGLKETRATMGTTNSSPTDPAYVPTTSTDSPGLFDTAPPHTLTETFHAITTDEPRSFFKHESDSEDSVLESPQPVFGRASSVKVSKPSIVQHTRTSRGRTSQTHSEGGSSAHRSTSPKHTHLAPTTEEVADVTENRVGTYMALTGEDILSGELAKPLAADMGVDEILPSRAYIVPSVQAEISNSNEPTRTKTEFSTESNVQDDNQLAVLVKPVILEHTPAPVPKIGRRVTIKPPNLLTNHLKDNKKPYRESIVTTPYPGSLDADGKSVKFEKNEWHVYDNAAKTPRPLVLQSSTTASGEDRFPSPERPEVLFLDLSLANQPCARITLEIQVVDKGTFDDEILFSQIRAAYFRKLLGFSRIAFTFVRIIGYATVTAPSVFSSADFDSLDFVRHFKHPRLGHRRKAWTIWLRHQNRSSLIKPSHTNSPQIGGNVQYVADIKQLSFRMKPTSIRHSRQSSTNKPVHTDRGVDTNDEKKRLSSPSTASSFNFVHSPLANHRIPFLNKMSDQSPTSPASCRSFFHSASMTSSSSDSTKVITISLHHRFSLLTISFLLFCTLLCSILASVLWIIYGVPGGRPGNARAVRQKTANVGTGGNDSGSFNHINTNWAEGASLQVLTGLVLGVALLLLGAVIDFGVIWGGWLLL